MCRQGASYHTCQGPRACRVVRVALLPPSLRDGARGCIENQDAADSVIPQVHKSKPELDTGRARAEGEALCTHGARPRWDLHPLKGAPPGPSCCLHGQERTGDAVGAWDFCSSLQLAGLCALAQLQRMQHPSLYRV